MRVSRLVKKTVFVKRNLLEVHIGQEKLLENMVRPDARLLKVNLITK